MSALPHLRPAPPRRAASSSVRRPSLRVVGRPSRVRGYVLLITGIATAAIFGSVSLNAVAAEHSFTARALSEDVQELTLQAEELTVEIARLESPRRIRRVAHNKLGLVTPDEPGYLIVDRNTSAEFTSFVGTLESRRRGRGGNGTQ